MDEATVRATVREYILEEFLPGEDASNLTDEVKIFETGILDSLAMLKLLSFLEEEFDITIEAQEVNEESLKTIGTIGQMVMTKL